MLGRHAAAVHGLRRGVRSGLTGSGWALRAAQVGLLQARAWRINKQDCWSSMAKGFHSRGVRIVAAGVVLHHSSPKCQVGSCPHLSLGPPTTTNVMDQQGLSWGLAKDVPILQSCIRDLFERDFSLVMVVQVMLVRQVQPCKRRPLRMWEFNPEGPRAIQHFLGMTHEEMYKSFFEPPNRVSGHHRGRGPEM